MCGIAGAVGQRSHDLIAWAHQCGSWLRHRGPDDEGYWLLTEAGQGSSYGGDDSATELGLRDVLLASEWPRAVLVHRRLAIIDPSPDGHQPMTLDDDGPTITYNGELYNYVELRVELQALGHQFRTASDTEVVLAAYVEWGDLAVRRFVGMWAFAIVDHHRGVVFMSRDPFGIKPLYYAHEPGSLAFCSEIGPLMELNWVDRTVDEQRVAAFLFDAQTDHPDTTFRVGVRPVPPATNLTIDLNAVEAPHLDRYWTAGANELLDISFEEAAGELRRLFLRSVELHLRSDVPVGACLSGGIDSSAIVCAMREIGGSSLDLHTFSYIADDPRVSEEAWVDLVSTYVGSTSHKVSPRPPDFGHDLPRLLHHQHEPFASTSVYAQYRVFAEARAAGVPVLLDGQGADELLGGYVAFRRTQLRAAMANRSVTDAWRLLAGLSRTSTSGHNDLISLIGGMLTKMRSSVSPRVRRGAGSRSSALIDPAWNVRRADLSSNNGGLRAQLVKAIELDSLPALLRYEDRNSMAHSIESRVPFLTPELADFALALPPGYLIDRSGRTKSVFRAAMRGLVPDAVLERTDKIGFVPTEKRWLQAAPLLPLPSGFEAHAGPIDTNVLAERLTGAFGDGDSIDMTLWRAWAVLQFQNTG